MPKLKAVVTKLDEVEEPLRSLYVEKNGKFVLDADGVEDVTGLKNALEAQKEAERKARREFDELKLKIGDMDPDKARAALKRMQELEDKTLLDEGKVEELIATRTERMRTDHDNQVKGFNTKIQELETSNTTLNKTLSEVLIDNALRAAASNLGVRATAMEDVILRGRQIWKLKDGKPTPFSGEQVIFGKNPNEPMSMDEWLGEMHTKAPHWFEGSNGSGSGNKPGGGGPPKKKRSEMSTKEKSDFITEHGEQEYAKLPA